MGLGNVIYRFLYNNPSSGDIKSTKSPCLTAEDIVGL